LLCAGTIAAQKSSSLPKKLPSVEKIVDNYLKAIGGKNKVAPIKDASYEWVIQLQGNPQGTARTKRRPPSSERWELLFGNGSVTSATSPTSAWEIGLDRQLHTLTGPEGAAAKLRALLDSSRLLNYKNSTCLRVASHSAISARNPRTSWDSQLVAEQNSSTTSVCAPL
jgi:hypothetical protein